MSALAAGEARAEAPSTMVEAREPAAKKRWVVMSCQLQEEGGLLRKERPGSHGKSRSSPCYGQKVITYRCRCPCGVRSGLPTGAGAAAAAASNTRFCQQQGTPLKRNLEKSSCGQSAW